MGLSCAVCGRTFSSGIFECTVLIRQNSFDEEFGVWHCLEHNERKGVVAIQGVRKNEMQVEVSSFPRGIDLVHVVLNRLVDKRYDGGVGDTCYRCPFATRPLTVDGHLAVWEHISNDPTEAYFRCYLPGRNSDELILGEHAPCTELEWINAALDTLNELKEKYTTLANDVTGG